MPVQFFGQYLLQHRILTAPQLLSAVEYQAQKNVNLGSLAVQRDWLTQEQVDQVTQLQKKQDVIFGKAAIALGLLDEAQVALLLTAQRNSHVHLGEAIVQLGLSTRHVVEKALRDFHAEQAEYGRVSSVVTFPEVEDAETYAQVIDLTSKMALRILGSHCKVDKQVLSDTHAPLSDLSSEVQFYGDTQLRYIIGAPRALLRDAARRNFDIEQAEDDMMQDMLGEFANVVCGNLAALWAKAGRSVDLKPPQLVVRDPVQKALSVSLVTPHGEVVLLLSLRR